MPRKSKPPLITKTDADLRTSSKAEDAAASPKGLKKRATKR